MTNAGDINEIVNGLMDVFFENSHSDTETIISYKHRRFLYQKQIQILLKETIIT